MKKTISAFTLVELIVVISILAILGAIAFLSMQGYSSNARDSTRTSDISNVKTSLELFITKTGNYPNPSNITSVTYSGAVAWNQGTFGNEPYKQLGDINKLPLDPLTNNEYTYSVTSSKTEYELAGVYEGSITKLDKVNNKEVLNKANAAQIDGTSKIVGTYNGVQLFVQSGSNAFTLFTPTIINGDLGTTDLQQIINQGKLTINGGKKLPDSYKNSNFKDSIITLNIPNILISTGSLTELTSKNQSGIDLRKTYLTNLKSILTGSTLSSNYNNIINLDVNSSSADLIALSLINGKGSVGGNTSVASTPTTPPVNSNCTSGQGFNGTSCITATQCNTGLESLTLSNGQTWSCKNLGATTVWDGTTQPTNCGGVSTTNCNAGNTWIGDYYQWGRNEPVNTTTTVATYNGAFSGLLGHNNFVLGEGSYGDWWQNEAGSSTPTRWTGTNPQGPCPSGWHVPSQNEWQIACNTISGTSCANNSTTVNVMKGTLKLPFAGLRNWNNAYYYNQSTDAYYWSGTPNSTNAYLMYFNASSIYPAGTNTRGYAFSLRCLKN